MSIGDLCELAAKAVTLAVDIARHDESKAARDLLAATRIWAAKVTHYADQLRLAGAQIEIVPPKRGES